MTIHNNQGIYSVECDQPDCGYEEELHHAESWGSALHDIKREGYKIQKINGEWFHTCPACQEKSE